MANSDTRTQPWHSDWMFAFNSQIVGQQELVIDPAQQWQCENRASIFSPAILARNNRSFDWFVISENENRERSPSENPPLQNAIARN